MPARNIVLVHGAFADGSSWAAVIAELHAAGLNALAVQNPLTSLAADVAATRWALDRLSAPAVLVGHSYGGTVISQAGDHPNVATLVFVAAIAPDVGENYLEVAGRFPPAPGGAGVRVADGLAVLDPDAFVDDFAQDLPRERARVLASVQGPIAADLFGQTTTVASWQNKPSFFAVSAQDRMVPPDYQRFAAERMGAEMIELDTSHASPVTRPQEIAQLIARATAI